MFWSPDGRSLAFLRRGEAASASISAAARRSRSAMSRPAIGLAGTWGADGQILFSVDRRRGDLERARRRRRAGGPASRPIRRQGARAAQLAGLPSRRPSLSVSRCAVRDGSGHLMIAEPGAAPREVRPMQSQRRHTSSRATWFLRRKARSSASGSTRSRGRSAAIRFPSPSGPLFLSRTTSVAAFAVARRHAGLPAAHDDEQRLVWFDRTGATLGAIWRAGPLSAPADFARWAAGRCSSRASALGAFDIWEIDLERGQRDSG